MCAKKSLVKFVTIANIVPKVGLDRKKTRQKSSKIKFMLTIFFGRIKKDFYLYKKMHSNFWTAYFSDTVVSVGHHTNTHAIQEKRKATHC